jgi:hypothetical protein
MVEVRVLKLTWSLSPAVKISSDEKGTQMRVSVPQQDFPKASPTQAVPTGPVHYQNEYSEIQRTRNLHQ